MTERIHVQPRRHTSSWSGRASHHRRAQVLARGAEAGAGLAVARETTAHFTTTAEDLWESLIEVLDSLEAPASAVLCSATGEPVAGHGLTRPELYAASAQVARMFAGRTGVPSPLGGVETVELTCEDAQTVIAAIEAPMAGTHLLAITASHVSMPLLKAWTARAADELRAAIAAHDGH